MSFIAATFLRLNNIGMVQRRDAVLQADKGTDTTITQTRLYDLQRYVSSHMNADMGTIYLENQYKRDSQKIIDSASSSTSYEDAKPFKEAQAVCAPRYANLGGYSLAYQQCVLDQLDSQPESANLSTDLQLPKADQYRFSFAAPVWSPDFAGFSVLICMLIILIIVARIGAIGVLKLILKIQHRGV